MLSAALAAGALLFPSPAGAGEPGHRENLPVIETAVGEEAADDRDDGRRTLGHIVGRAMVRRNSEPLGSAGSLIESAHVMPILAPGFQGVQVAMTF
jgi:hypothetical protein